MEQARAFQDDADRGIGAHDAEEVIDAFDHVIEALDQVYKALAQFAEQDGVETTRR